MLFYLPYGESQAVVASNAGAARSPAWWLNVQAEPLASVDLPGGSTRVRARVADPQEHAALWARSTEQLDDYARYAASAEREIPVVILEPLPKEAHA
jgi:deazaflavin-dependent oxidoreductase (nitroreductase family)